MSIPLLTYYPSSQNERVAGYEISGDEQPRVYSKEILVNSQEIDQLIFAAYSQIFHEQQILASTRQTFLESQLRSGQITVREFIRGLATSEPFKRLNYDCNNNYRFVDICMQRILGRSVYNERENHAWSIILATKGLQGFIDSLLNSEEYLENFGEETVPYQRRRILPTQLKGELPFARTSRYGKDYRDKLPFPSGFGYQPLNWKTFRQSSDWSVILLMLIATTGLAAVFCWLSIDGILLNFGGY